MKNYPTLERCLSAPDKARVFAIHRSIRSRIPHICFFFILVFGVYFANYLDPTLAFRSYIPLIDKLSNRWLAVFPALVLLEFVREHYDDLYVFGLEKILHSGGRLSLRHIVPSIKYIDIRAILVQQGIIGRLLNYGDVLLGTAAQDTSELVLTGVVSPGRLAALIEELRTHNSENKSDEAAGRDGE